MIYRLPSIIYYPYIWIVNPTLLISPGPCHMYWVIILVIPPNVGTSTQNDPIMSNKKCVKYIHHITHPRLKKELGKILVFSLREFQRKIFTEKSGSQNMLV